MEELLETSRVFKWNAIPVIFTCGKVGIMLNIAKNIGLNVVGKSWFPRKP